MRRTLDIPPPGTTRILGRNVNAEQVAQWICELIYTMFWDAKTRSLAHDIVLQGGDVINELAALAYTSMKFSPDIKHQVLRTPARSLADGLANCVDYTIFIGSIAHVLGLPVVVRIARFHGKDVFTHVYPIVDGIPMDMVIGQENGQRSYPFVGIEVAAVETKDFFITPINK
jgi:hypothetical protein